jgi:hypothetical protein
VLELVVALVVTGLVATVGAGAFEQLIARRANVLAATIATERASARRALLQEWVTGGTLIQPLRHESVEAEWRAFDTTLAETLRPPATRGDALWFETSAATPAAAPNVTMRLYVDDDRDTAERGLCVSFRRGPEAPVERLELDPTVTALHVDYLAAEDRRWLAARDVGGVPVLAARLRLDVADGGAARLATLPLTVPVRPHGTLPAKLVPIGARE